ncbi:hypothetical protein ILYODFUR_033690 [Ilyodon furcidens]|uniref:Uncharacterized protein n=1 Tax=Ilyodon furcidens TaxID=33524 RepID=A0ABV0UCF0_9TELE
MYKLELLWIFFDPQKGKIPTYTPIYFFPGNGTYRCALLVELDYLYNLYMVEVSHHATSSDTDNGQNAKLLKGSKKKNERGKMSVASSHCCPLIHLLLISLTPEQLTLINNLLYY